MNEQTVQQTDEAVDALNRRERRRGLAWLGVGVVMALLTVGVGVAVNDADDAKDETKAIRSEAAERDTKIDNLEKALEAQRAQFEACRDKDANAPGCKEPVAPSPSQIGPQGIQGIQGIPGEQGAQGPQGLQGVPGEDGEPGPIGPRGLRGLIGAIGPAGLNGSDGATGPAGAQGPAGPKGDTGAQGPAGPAGPAGQDAPRITAVNIAGDPSNCALIITLSNEVSYSTPIPPQFCVGP